MNIVRRGGRPSGRGRAICKCQHAERTMSDVLKMTWCYTIGQQNAISQVLVVRGIECCISLDVSQNLLPLTICLFARQLSKPSETLATAQRLVPSFLSSTSQTLPSHSSKCVNRLTNPPFPNLANALITLITHRFTAGYHSCVVLQTLPHLCYKFSSSIRPVAFSILPITNLTILT